MTETEVTGAVNGSDELAREAEIVQGFHADEPLEVVPEQQREGWTADMADFDVANIERWNINRSGHR